MAVTLEQRHRSPTRLWTLDFVLDLLTAHCLFASYTAMFTLIPLYVFYRGGDEWQLGIVVGSFGIVGLLVRPFAGRWIYTVGAKKIAIAGPAVFAAATLLHILAVDVWLIVPARVLQGIGLAMGPVATSTIVANLAPERRRAEAMGYMGNSIAAANLYSPTLAFWVLDALNFQSAFVYAALIGLGGSFAAMGMSAARTNLPSRPRAGERKIPLINRRALFPAVVFLTYTITTAPVSTFLPLLADERGFGNPGFYFTLHSITSIPALAVSGFVSDRLGRGAVIVPGLLVAAAGMFVLTAAGMFVLAAAEIRLLFMASGVLSGLGFGMLQPAMQSLTVDRVPARERSSALATLQAAWDIGGSGGAFVFGTIGAVTGAAATFAMAGVGTTLGALGYVGGSVRSSRTAQRDEMPSE